MFKDKNGQLLKIGDYVCYNNEKYEIFYNKTYTSIKKINDENSVHINIKYIQDKLTKIPIEYIKENYPECLV
ncbi:hypothetical protein CKA55_09755 [Arcobacter suis]|uniref:Uncharacterized protein n=1 Tax=Arcobacter suis CECT 7833 TaxID=663365 RepID=A0AAD0SQQ1_9BACT|nr:hypothetical protein [Arcobacter suis]AXX89695.1 hypothetical protein ASUIS_1207 [Arcobacter suis CECT 7833]RWS46018.1 hypothetical protein CKA55_09755 [Arcobacter suis]